MELLQGIGSLCTHLIFPFRRIGYVLISILGLGTNADLS